MHFKSAEFDFSESIFTLRINPCCLKMIFEMNYLLNKQILLLIFFIKFEFNCILFSEIRLNFCSPHAISVFRIHKNAFGTFIFSMKIC